MRFGILQNTQKKETAFYADRLREAITASGGKWFMLDEKSEAGIDADVLISVGGDGTFLTMAAMAFRHDIPALGLNFGTLGMLTEFDRNDIDRVVRRLNAGDYSIDSRTVLEITVFSGSSPTMVTSLFDRVTASW